MPSYCDPLFTLRRIGRSIIYEMLSAAIIQTVEPAVQPTLIRLLRPFLSLQAQMLSILLLLVCTACVSAAVLVTNPHPIITNVRKPNRQMGTTKPIFFQQVLGLKPGKAFNFNIEKWKALVHSGLFANLTASSYEHNDGVVLNITGVELPTTYFTPEASIVASLDNPEVLGGITWKNINFRGMGEQFHASISKKEGLEEGMTSLDPTISFKWLDNRIGKTSRISVAHHAENVLESCRDVLTLAAQRAVAAVGGQKMITQRTSVRCTSSSLSLQENVPVTKGPLSRIFSHLTYGIEPFKKTMRMYSTEDGQGDLQCSLVGGKVSLNADIQGVSVSGWHEGGNAITSPRKASSSSNLQQRVKYISERFSTLGLKVVLPTMRQSVALGPLAQQLRLPQLQNKTLSVQQSSKLKALKSWGPGCVSLHHHSDASSSSTDALVRGLPHSDAGARIAQGVSVKSDVYVGGVLPAGSLLGMFCDVGVLRAAERADAGVGGVNVDQDSFPARNRRKPYMLESLVCSVGVSLRALGLRADYGYRLGQRTRAPQLHVGFDLGD